MHEKIISTNEEIIALMGKQIFEVWMNCVI